MTSQKRTLLTLITQTQTQTLTLLTQTLTQTQTLTRLPLFLSLFKCLSQMPNVRPLPFPGGMFVESRVQHFPTIGRIRRLR